MRKIKSWRHGNIESDLVSIIVVVDNNYQSAADCIRRLFYTTETLEEVFIYNIDTKYLELHLSDGKVLGGESANYSYAFDKDIFSIIQSFYQYGE